MAKRNASGGWIGLALAALCFAAALFLFQAHAEAGQSTVYLHDSATHAR